MAASEDKELGSDAELREGHLGKHGKVASGDVAGVETGFIGEDLDEALEGALGKEGVVQRGERVERDAVLGEKGKEGVKRVVEESGSEEAASGGDQSRG